jgi:hypothetical protein
LYGRRDATNGLQFRSGYDEHAHAESERSFACEPTIARMVPPQRVMDAIADLITRGRSDKEDGPT